MPNKLLSAFSRLFAGAKYRHRASTHGDTISAYLYEDLLDHAESMEHSKLAERIVAGSLVYNKSNRVVNGHRVRRGDGLLGQVVPHEEVTAEPGYRVKRGPVANIRVGIEMKIVSTAMQKQFDRVFCDIWKQERIFELVSPDSIRVAIIAINHSDTYRSYEGEKHYDSSPIREAPRVLTRFAREVELYRIYDELIFIPFQATNISPFPFAFVDDKATARLYNAAIARLANAYAARFP